MARISTLALLLTLATFIYIFAVVESTDTSSTEFIKASCNVTTYPELCVQSLSVYAPTIQQSPRQLANTALNVSLARAHFAHKFVWRLKKFKGLKMREYKAIEVCCQEMEDTVYRLKISVDELANMGRSRKDFIWHMSNVQTWVSAALTDETTCFDGFAGRFMDGKIKNSTRAQIVYVAQITSNALALVNKFADP